MALNGVDIHDPYTLTHKVTIIPTGAAAVPTPRIQRLWSRKTATCLRPLSAAILICGMSWTGTTGADELRPYRASGYGGMR